MGRVWWTAVLGLATTLPFIMPTLTYTPGTPRSQLEYLIKMDISRTHPSGFESLFLNPHIVTALNRLLFVWASVPSRTPPSPSSHILCLYFFLSFFRALNISQILCFLLHSNSQVHPDVNYYQGLLNEICVPFFLVFLTSALGPLSDYDHQYVKNPNVETRMRIELQH